MTVAEERLDVLADLAAAVASDDGDLAREYVRLARRIAERHRLELPSELKRFTCDSCNAYWRVGDNVRVRVHDGRVVYSCDCGAHTRYPYSG